MRLARVLPLALSSLLAVACGGGGGSPDHVLTLASTASLDGEIEPGSVFTSDVVLDVGDADSGAVAYPRRCFWSFDLAPIPAGATVVSALFTTRQVAVSGSPYADGHGVVVLDHLDYGPSLDLGDFGLAAIAPAFATLCADASLGDETVDVTARVLADRAAGRPRTQFRARFSLLDSDNDSVADEVQLTPAEAPAGAPTLTIRYR